MNEAIVLLCAGKDSEAVEYDLSRSVSPALIAEYQTRLPDRALLRRKLQEFYQLVMPKIDAEKKRAAMGEEKLPERSPSP